MVEICLCLLLSGTVQVIQVKSNIQKNAFSLQAFTVSFNGDWVGWNSKNCEEASSSPHTFQQISKIGSEKFNLVKRRLKCLRITTGSPTNVITNIPTDSRAVILTNGVKLLKCSYLSAILAHVSTILRYQLSLKKQVLTNIHVL